MIHNKLALIAVINIPRWNKTPPSLPGEVLRSEIFQGPYDGGVYASIALETLNLGSNQIHSLDRNLFEHTPNLTRLYLNDNPIEMLDHVTVSALAMATNLEVRNSNAQ